MDNKGTYKNFKEADINASKRVLTNSLFETKNVLEDPWTDYESETISSDLAPIDYIKRTETDVYFSYVRGEYIEDVIGSEDQNEQSKALMYYQMVQLMGLSEDKYPIETESISQETDEIDIISVSRNYYKDMIDREFFGLFIKDPSDELDGLFPGDTVRRSDIGRRVYLYKYNGSDPVDPDLYDSSTDSLTVPTQSDLDKTQPYGEVHLDSGIIVLFLDKLRTGFNLAGDSEVLDYLKSFGGNSKIQVNSTIYSAILFNDEFNHTINSTYYEEDNPDIVKEKFRSFPITYPTMIGLYNENNEIIAVGRFSKTFQKNPLNAATIKAELSY